VRRRRVLLVGGLIGVGIYKFSKRDADRIQQHTGVPPEELEEADLERAMDELEIDKQTISSADQETSAPSASGADSTLDELKKLGELHADGVLTDEEFATMKSKLLET